MCEAGYACEGTGLTAPDNECVEGYYCPEGMSVFSVWATATVHTVYIGCFLLFLLCFLSL